MVKQQDHFRKYDSLEDSVRDYGLFFTENNRYKPLLEAKTLDDQIDGLGKSGYATDSKYGAKISGNIKFRHLRSWDSMKLFLITHNTNASSSALIIRPVNEPA